MIDLIFAELLVGFLTFLKMHLNLFLGSDSKYSNSALRKIVLVSMGVGVQGGGWVGGRDVTNDVI